MGRVGPTDADREDSDHVAASHEAPLVFQAEVDSHTVNDVEQVFADHLFGVAGFDCWHQSREPGRGRKQLSAIGEEFGKTGNGRKGTGLRSKCCTRARPSGSGCPPVAPES